MFIRWNLGVRETLHDPVPHSSWEDWSAEGEDADNELYQDNAGWLEDQLAWMKGIAETTAGQEDNNAHDDDDELVADVMAAAATKVDCEVNDKF